MLSSVAGFDIAAVNRLQMGSSNNVNRIIRVLGSARFKTDAAWGPPDRGMNASKRIRSGFHCVAESIACTPSSASPQISYPTCSSRGRMRQRIDGLTSTMKRLGTRYCCQSPTRLQYRGSCILPPGAVALLETTDANCSVWFRRLSFVWADFSTGSSGSARMLESLALSDGFSLRIREATSPRSSRRRLHESTLSNSNSSRASARFAPLRLAVELLSSFRFFNHLPHPAFSP
jgi:hypothetical protein